MNKTFSKLIFLLFLVTSLTVIAEEQNFTIEVRSGAFIPSSKRLREIYGNVGASYQLEASFTCRCLDIWGNIDWFSKHGKPKGCHGSTRVSIANWSAGIKYPYSFCNCFTVYAGIGLSLAKIWIHNKADCSREKISKIAIGGVLKTGICYFATENLFFDFFVDYLYQPVRFEKSIDIGGVKTGLGMGLSF